MKLTLQISQTKTRHRLVLEVYKKSSVNQKMKQNTLNKELIYYQMKAYSETYFIIINRNNNIHVENFCKRLVLKWLSCMLSTAFYEFHVISINKIKKSGPFIKFSYWTVFPFPNLNVIYFERSSRSNLSNIKFQRSNLNS